MSKQRRQATVLLGVLALVAGCSSSHGGAKSAETTTSTTRPLVAVTVVSGSLRRVVQVRLGAPLTQALALAKVLPVDGRLLSALTHRPLGVAHPARMTLGGQAVTLGSTIDAAGSLVITNGIDEVEPTVVGHEPTLPPGRPRALQYVYTAGRPGLAEVTRGKTSGEIVRQQALDPGAASVRVPGNVVALTFDDGPGAYTGRVLDILKAKGVHATFCLIGRQAKAQGALVRQELAEGHQLCNHTFDHDEHLAKASAARIDQQVAAGSDAIVAAGGPRPSLYRPPAGSLSPAVYAGVAARHEQVLFWSDDPEDWKKPPALEIVNRVMAKLRPGAIVLLHDGGGNRDNTLAALPVIIDQIRAKAYTFTFALT